MTEEVAAEEEDDAGDAAESCVQEPEVCRRHFFQETADPADEIVGREEGQIINSDDGGGQGSRRNPRIKRKRNGKDVGEPDAVEHVECDEPADRNL